MNAYMNIKKSLTLLAVSAFMFLASILASNVVWLTAALMITATAGIAIGGAYFIRSTWMRNDAKREQQQWGRFDFAEPR